MTPRKRASVDCPDCKQRPSAEHGQLVCACGRVWQYQPGTAGSPEEQELLRQNGWEFKPGDGYWLSPDLGLSVRPKLYLYQDETWESDTHEEPVFEDYLIWYSKQVHIIRANRQAK